MLDDEFGHTWHLRASKARRVLAGVPTEATVGGKKPRRGNRGGAKAKKAADAAAAQAARPCCDRRDDPEAAELAVIKQHVPQPEKQQRRLLPAVRHLGPRYATPFL